MESHRRRSSLSQEAGEEYTASEFGGIRDYKRRKRVKLQNQDAAYRAQQTTPSPMIFKGYTIAALGYTNPNSNVLRSMVVKHGGVWKEFKEHGLTIVVATAIPPKKREEYRRLRIVEPKWIIDCVEAGKILEWSRYRIGGEGEAQATLGFDASVQKPKLAVNSYKDIASDQVVKEALKFARLREFDSQLPSDCEIPESDEEGDMALDESQGNLSWGKPTTPKRPPPEEVEEDDAPPCAQPPPKEEEDDDDYYEDMDGTPWVRGPDGQIAPPCHQPERRYVSNPKPEWGWDRWGHSYEDQDEDEDEDEDDVVQLVSIPEVPAEIPVMADQVATDDIPPESESEFDDNAVEPQVVEEKTSNEPPPPTGKINGIDAYEAEAVIGEKRHPANRKPRNMRGKIKYLIKWKGYPDEKATWEWEGALREDLGDDYVDEMVAQYAATKTPKVSQRRSQKRTPKARRNSRQKTPTPSQDSFSSVNLTPTEEDTAPPSCQLEELRPAKKRTLFSSAQIGGIDDNAQEVTAQQEAVEKPQNDGDKLPRGFSFMPESFSSVDLSDDESEELPKPLPSHQPELLVEETSISGSQRPTEVKLPRGFTQMESFSSVNLSDDDAAPYPQAQVPKKPSLLPWGFSDMPSSFSSVYLSETEDNLADEHLPLLRPEEPQVEIKKPSLPRGFSNMPSSFSSVVLSDDDEPPKVAKRPPSRRPPSHQLPVVAEEDEDEESISSSQTEVPSKPTLLQEVEDDAMDTGEPVGHEKEEEEEVSLPEPSSNEAVRPIIIHRATEIPDSYSSLDLLSDLDLPEGYSTPTSSPPDKMPKAPSLKRSASITAPFTTIKKPKLPDPDVNLREESPRPRIASPSTVAPRLTKENAQTPEEFNEIFLSDPKVYAASVLNPDFLPKFFKESRLHHLSTWKAELRSRMQERAQKASQISPPKARATRYIMHVDFDCFFAAVSTRDLPDLKNKPVAICHGRTENSATSEIASCNYAARKFGVKNGMWMASAKRLCPDIVALGYDFDKYEEASEAFYSVVLALGGERLQAVSVDEVLVDISNLVCNDYYSDQGQEEAAAMKLATTVRNECRKRTGCEVSVGIGMNVVMARLALRKAKPAGQLMIPRSEIRSVLDELNVSAFPGIGKHTSNRIIEKFGTDSVLEVRKIPRERLRQTLGVKTGERVYELCNGIDHTQVGAAKTLRESISISVNWGVRFTEMGQAEEFLHRLSQAVVEKMKGEKVKGRVLNFKVAKRAQGVPYETEKFLGCGKVEEMNKTFSFGAPTNDAILIVRKCVELLKGFRVSPGDIRGFGIGMKGLEDEDDGQQQLKFAKAVETQAKTRPMPQPQQQPELKPAAAVKVSAYVKPKPMTLFDAFSKKANKQLAPTIESKAIPLYRSPTESGKLPLPSIKDKDPPPIQMATPIEPAKAPSRPHPPQLSVGPGILSTQFEIPSPSQIDDSCLPFLPAHIQELVRKQQDARKEAEKERMVRPGIELEAPPNSQWDMETWNSFSQSVREDIRAEHEREKAAEEQHALARETSFSPKKRTPFSRSPSKPEQQQPFPKSPSNRDVSRPAFDTTPIPSMFGKVKDKSAVKPPLKPKYPIVYDRHGNEVSSWLFAPQETGGGGIDPEIFQFYDQCERATIISDAVAARNLYLQKDSALKATKQRERERLENAVILQVNRRRPVLCLSAGGEVASTDLALVRKAIRTWVCAMDAENKVEEGDYEMLCGFLRSVVLDEGRLDKAAVVVRYFLALCGEKEGWGWVCHGIVEAVREAAWVKGVPNVQF